MSAESPAPQPATAAASSSLGRVFADAAAGAGDAVHAALLALVQPLQEEIAQLKRRQDELEAEVAAHRRLLELHTKQIAELKAENGALKQGTFTPTSGGCVQPDAARRSPLPANSCASFFLSVAVSLL